MIEAEPEHYEQLGAFYQAKRDRFREQLLTTKLVPLPVPGGYFQLVDYSAVSGLDDARILPLAYHREGRHQRSRCRRSTKRRRPVSAWRGCASPRTTPPWTPRSSGCSCRCSEVRSGSL